MPARKKSRAPSRAGRAPGPGARRAAAGAARRSAPPDLSLAQAVQLGRRRAAQTLARQRKAAAGRRKALAFVLERDALARAWALAPAGLLMVQGDSWFDYGTSDIRDLLQFEYKYQIEGEAKHGMRIVNLAQDTKRLNALCDRIAAQHGAGKQPKAILLSGGGNDIADNFAAYLNPRNSPQSGWNPTLLDRFVNGTLRTAYSTIIAHLDAYCTRLLQRPVPILVHGYANPVPDGRGLWIGDRGWLKPGFVQRDYHQLPERTELARQFIGRFNQMLSDLPGAAGMSSVVYVDLRPALSSGSDWRDWWENELHPTDDRGFPAVAKIFADKLADI